MASMQCILQVESTYSQTEDGCGLAERLRDVLLSVKQCVAAHYGTAEF